MLNLALVLAVQVFDAPMPAEIRSRISADLPATTLARVFGHRLLDRELTPLGSVARFDLRRRMLADKGAGWAYSMRLTLAPAQDDWSELHLPRPLVPLYVLLRYSGCYGSMGCEGGNRSSESGFLTGLPGTS